ncbi:MAG: hypothetical protein KGJ88_03250 [Verrucomicrobiota bacterium]|nr:hypothetical protein [Verrucomicrobiota bacterium]
MVATAVVVVATLAVGGWFGYSKIKGNQRPAGNPAAYVPKPTAMAATAAGDILTNVLDAYANLKSLTVNASAIMVMDMSKVTLADVNPGAAGKFGGRQADLPKGMTNTADVSIKLMRPDLYRIESKNIMQMSVRGRTTMATNTTAAWSSGATNYVLMQAAAGRGRRFNQYYTVPDKKMAYAMGGSQGVLIPSLFFNDQGNVSEFMSNLGQTEDEAVDGQDCYTLTGSVMGQKLKLWVSKTSFLILRSEITLGGEVNTAQLQKAMRENTNAVPGMSKAQMNRMMRRQASIMPKISGTMTDTYDYVDTNQAFSADDFNYSVPPGVRLTAFAMPPGMMR